MPEGMMPYTNSDQMAELLKFTDTQDSVKVKNIFNGITSIDSISVDFAKISLSKVSELQLKLLQTSDSSQIICEIKTIKKPIKESVIKFYSTDWQPLDSVYGLPQNLNSDSLLKMFVQKPDTMSNEKFEELRNYIEPVIMTAHFDKKYDIITFNLSLPFVQKDNYKELNAIIKKISFKWDGQNFKKC